MPERSESEHIALLAEVDKIIAGQPEANRSDLKVLLVECLRYAKALEASPYDYTSPDTSHTKIYGLMDKVGDMALVRSMLGALEGLHPELTKHIKELYSFTFNDHA
jgi:hypothetical protein